MSFVVCTWFVLVVLVLIHIDLLVLLARRFLIRLDGLLVSVIVLRVVRMSVIVCVRIIFLRVAFVLVIVECFF